MESLSTSRARILIRPSWERRHGLFNRLLGREIPPVQSKNGYGLRLTV